MFADARLAELDKEKSALLAEAEVLRTSLGEHVRQVGARVLWVSTIGQRLPAFRPILMAGAAAAGFLMFRNFRTVLRWAPTLIGALRFARQVTRHTGAPLNLGRFFKHSVE